ncbi:S1-C subfamily serine protease [Haloferula luteola]|uniref:S1-C subfamily serine protease n=1 Tax=Haloferula luteola TaxID=595692 RepID=A0A840V2P4_9BACT|nr:PDZ domain-containing protein [Haloferula luteola]MBB5352262.1 S1-C subfamily serine protease [Haloferula luteola]
MRARHLICYSLAGSFVFTGCDRTAPAPSETPPVVVIPEAPVPAADLTHSVVRVNTTYQAWNPGQPWEKLEPRQRRSLGAVLKNHQVLTTAEMVADSTFIELESSDGRKLTPATVTAVDYEANLALLALDDDEFSADLEPLDLADDSKIGDELDIVQIENSGLPLITHGLIQSMDVVSNFLPGQYFLTYELKASMQTAASSFTLPALKDGKLAGLLTSYSSSDQLSDITATEIVRHFLADAADGDYVGFPSLGISTAALDDDKFRDWLGLDPQTGGIYISGVLKGGAAEAAGVQVGDVVTSIAGFEVDPTGYIQHPIYGRLFWSHLVRGAQPVGATLPLEVIRNGEKQTLEATLTRRESSLVPLHTFGEAPRFVVKGGLVFQELTRDLLRSFGKEWRDNAPLNLLEAYDNPEAFEDRMDHVVFLAGVIPTPATIGYESLRNLIVTEVNEQPIRDMKSLAQAFETVPANGLHTIRFDDQEVPIELDESVSTVVDGQLLQRGLSRLSRLE